MKIGVIGYGSIGRRHVANLLDIGQFEITLFRTLESGNEWNLREVVGIPNPARDGCAVYVISNPAALHCETILPLILTQCNLLVEKPLVASEEELSLLSPLIDAYSGIGMMTYNMRFHPCTIEMQKFLRDQRIGKVLSARFEVGQYLPDWHPGSDYRLSYSANTAMGGGVYLDLIHEIDLAMLLTGKPAGTPRSIGGRFSDLEIETEDVAELIYASDQGTLVSIHMDYLFRGYRRQCMLIGEEGTIHCDYASNRVYIQQPNGNIGFDVRFKSFQRNDMYKSMMKYYIGCVTKEQQPYPTLKDGMESLRLALQAKAEGMRR